MTRTATSSATANPAPSTIRQAVTLHQQGQLDEAERLYTRILQDQHDHFDALHLLGVLMHQRGRSEEALDLIAKALATKARSADAYANHGRVLTALRRHDEALASYDLALALKPDHLEALFHRGNALHELKRSDEALKSIDRALALRPNYADALNNRGVILHELKRYDEALASYDRALVLLPDNASALHNSGNALGELKRFDEALANYDRALAVRPDYAEALYNRGKTLNEMGRHDEALASYDRALALQPDYAEALYNRGNLLNALDRHDEALASYDRVLSVQPNNVEVLNNRGSVLKELKRLDEALASYDRALVLRPDYAEAHWNEALSRLLTGDYRRGWAKYEWRWKYASMALAKRNFPQPLWLGDDAICGKTILLYSEQGLGDTIQFCRYVPLVAARGAHVILEVEKPLQSLFNTFADSTQVICKGDPLPDFDVQCPLLSLPLAFGTRIVTIPSDTPYLHVPPQALKIWDTRLGPKRRPRIGLAWSGNAAHKNDRNRSIKLRDLLPLLDSEATFVSLQKDARADDMAVLRERDDILHFGDALGDFSDTAALVSLLDLVISVDTSIAHLAGALGKPAWVLLTHVPDFRWLLDRDDSPWYPTVRLFRQDGTRAWGNVIARIREALLKLRDASGNATSESWTAKMCCRP
jgi:tetratricopeptide (TPR) repeat protein